MAVLKVIKFINGQWGVPVHVHAVSKSQLQFNFNFDDFYHLLEMNSEARGKWMSPMYCVLSGSVCYHRTSHQKLDQAVLILSLINGQLIKSCMTLLIIGYS